jgi:peptidoglycan L-alanyl-D-glutamate endopeptidase CwlK
MSSRLLIDLHPAVREMAQRGLAECARKGLDVLVTCTFRPDVEQNELFAVGRTRPGRILTNARAGESAHNYMIAGKPAALAFDVVPLRFGKPVWGLKGDGIDDNHADDNTDDLELWQRVRACFEGAGLKSASRWVGKMREWPHHEHPDAKALMS